MWTIFKGLDIKRDLNSYILKMVILATYYTCFSNRCQGRLWFFLFATRILRQAEHCIWITLSPVLRDHSAAGTWHEHVSKAGLAGCWEVKTQEARLPSWNISHGQRMKALSIFFMKLSKTVVSTAPGGVNLKCSNVLGFFPHLYLLHCIYNCNNSTTSASLLTLPPGDSQWCCVLMGAI